MKKRVKGKFKKLNMKAFKKFNLSNFINSFKDMSPKTKLKYGLLGTILFMTIGYAAINTSLGVEGLLSLKSKFYKVYISSLKMDGINIGTKISEDGESFTLNQQK